MRPAQAERRIAFYLAESKHCEEEGEFGEAAAYKSGAEALASMRPRLREVWAPGTITQKVRHDEDSQS